MLVDMLGWNDCCKAVSTGIVNNAGQDEQEELFDSILRPQ